jgi:hypothetical protein
MKNVNNKGKERGRNIMVGGGGGGGGAPRRQQQKCFIIIATMHQIFISEFVVALTSVVVTICHFLL